MSTLSFTWDAPSPNPDSYTVYYRVQGTLAYTSDTVTEPSWSVTGLDCCTEYEGYIVSNCGLDESTPVSFEVDILNTCCAEL